MAASTAKLMALAPINQLICAARHPDQFFFQPAEKPAQIFKRKTVGSNAIVREFGGITWKAVQCPQVLFVGRGDIEFC
jgi:hypothetical protein